MSRVEQNYRRLPCKGMVLWFITCTNIERFYFISTFMINVIIYILQPLRPYKVLIFAPTQLFIRFIREICIGAEQLFSVARVLEIKRSVICLAHGSRPTAVLLAPFAPHPDSTQCCLNEWCLFSTELCDLVSQIHLTVCTSHTCLFLVG